MKFLKGLVKGILIIFLSLIVLLLIFAAFAIAPVDKTPMIEFEAYQKMMMRLDSIGHFEIKKPVHALRVGYGRVSITPPFRTATAGYGKRKGQLYDSIRDSIYVRTIVVDNGSERAAVVSADLLIIPPAVTEVLQRRLPEAGFTLDNTFLGATHSHNSIGNWSEGAAQFIYGEYRQEVVDLIADAIVRSIRTANANLLDAKMKHGMIDLPGAVQNRIVENGPKDPLVRLITFHRSDSSKLLLINYTAHATCLYSGDLNLSADYPGKLVDLMEESSYDFAMFMAGAVGSHGCNPPSYGDDCIDWMAQEIAGKINQASMTLAEDDATVHMERIALELPEPQVKLNADWKARAWLFEAALGTTPNYLTSLRIGNVVLLGTPCDFSGEFDPQLDTIAAVSNLSMMVTSFNGGYIGYVTPAKYFDEGHYETRLMNWYPPGNGEYITECLAKLITASAGK